MVASATAACRPQHFRQLALPSGPDRGRRLGGERRCVIGVDPGVRVCKHRPSPAKMMSLINRILDWFKSLFWKEEMELTLVGLQYSGKTTFVNVIAVSVRLRAAMAVVVATPHHHLGGCCRALS